MVGWKKERFEMAKKKSEVEERVKQAEVKERIPVWLYPSTLAAIDKNLGDGNCKSRSDFLDQAALGIFPVKMPAPTFPLRWCRRSRGRSNRRKTALPGCFSSWP